MYQKKILFGCTSLKTKDKQGNIYHGRTLEYNETLPSNVEYYPIGSPFIHKAPDGKSDGLSYKSQYELLFVSTLSGFSSLSLPLEGVNSAGLSGSLNMKKDSLLPELPIEKYNSSLHWLFLLEWALATCSSIADIKNKIKNISLWTTGIPSIDPAAHYIFYDTTGACLVVEVSNGIMSVIDNPTGVLTNGPEFTWHLTNLNNYTHLTNIDVNNSNLGGMALKQPDAGISTDSLPSSDTAVGRFVRAVFYSSFVKEEDTPEKALIELSHVMNKFDRPKNITGTKQGDGFLCEYSVWISLTDIQNKEMYVRTYDQLNYQKFSLNEFSKEGKKMVIPIVK